MNDFWINKLAIKKKMLMRNNIDRLPASGNPVGNLKYSKSFSAGLSSSIFSNISHTSFFDESL